MIGRVLDSIGRYVLHLLDRLELVEEVRPTVRIHHSALSCALEGREADGPTPTLLEETEELLEPGLAAGKLPNGGTDGGRAEK